LTKAGLTFCNIYTIQLLGAIEAAHEAHNADEPMLVKSVTLSFGLSYVSYIFTCSSSSTHFSIVLSDAAHMAHRSASALAAALNEGKAL
jgi:hypothetical protein